MKTLKTVGIAAFCLAGITLAPTARGAVAYDFAPGTPDTAFVGNQAGDLSLGTVFTVNSPISITGLRLFDNEGNGYSAPVTVTLYAVALNQSGAIIGGLNTGVTATFSGNGLPFDASTQTRLVDIADYNVSSGTFMIVANKMGSGPGAIEQNYNSGGPATIPTSTGGGLIEHKGSYFNVNEDWSYPGLPATWGVLSGPADSQGWVLDSANIIYTAANFDFTAVPEAQHFAFAGAALMGLVYVGRTAMIRRKVKA